MSKTNARCARQRAHVNEPAPWVAKFTQGLVDAGYTSQTVRYYDAVARHLAHWLLRAEVAITDVDEIVIGRFARHRCRCFGQRRATRISSRYVTHVRNVVELLGKLG